MNMEKGGGKVLDEITSLKEMNGEGKVLDITEKLKCYEKGKTWKCECGQKIGVKHDKKLVKCANCGTICVDGKWEERDENSGKNNRETIVTEEQSSLGDF